MKQLTDSSPMPWGKHKGVLMREVPASYLFWLWTGQPAKERDSRCPVADYIRRNLASLQLDYPDGIWSEVLLGGKHNASNERQL